MRRLIVTVLLGALLTSAAAAGPFGINQGDKLEQLPGATSLGNRMFQLSSVPKPHPLFTDYSVELVDDLGVCRVNASSELFKDDKFGLNAKQRYGEVKAQLTSLYGKGGDGEGEFLRDGAIWDGPQEFVMSLKQNERVHQTWWSKKDGSKLKDAVKTIALAIKGLDANTSMLVLQYAFENEAECKKKASISSSDAL